jgi:2-polyprenyl-3-methyl-5-hydroxy-6-metoxy-1,4-benzoquinol methylase
MREPFSASPMMKRRTKGTMIHPDKSNGYDDLAEVFMQMRNPRIGPSTVLEWSQTLVPHGSILELGCGNGVISQILIEAGFSLYGIDASPKMVRAFREQFPNAQAECAAVEDSSFFDRTFDGIVAWGLMFLLQDDVQKLVIAKAAKALKPRGQLMFTSPRDAVTWQDSITGRESRSLGAKTYRQLLEAQGLIVTEDRLDEGDNYYYTASKPKAVL